MESAFNIKCAVLADCYCVAKVHKSIFADHLLGRLPVWLIRQYYVCLCREGAILLVSEDEERSVSGFLLGGSSIVLNHGKNVFLKRCWWAFGTCILMDRLALQLFKRTYLRSASQGGGGKSSYPMRLLSIGVRKDMQGSGVASALLSYFEAILTANDSIKGYGFVHNDNARAIRFYQKNGFYVETVTEMSTYLGKRFE